ncbi:MULTISPECIES: AAA family ATPase [Pantoea]|uniref:ATPase AAA-type core domain-containing protein n=2 Tax=Pantoea TaxID=53335 RepID=A0A0U3U9R5_9GAMM|nr:MULTISPECIES: AAA family ATPase [Pantoea]ALV92031.1 hypothetical protein LK04_07690 [Pantoea vagans]KHJ66012.1 hypothetical protein QU24_21575 [Pantoea rodasii]
MELVYVFALEHKILNGFGAKFSSNFDVSVTDEVISINRNTKSVDYYDGLSIKAIVGKNGAGKSSLLDFIEESCNQYTESRGFIIWHDPERDEIIIHDIGRTLYTFSVDSCLQFKIVENNSAFFKKNNHKIYKVNNLPSNDLFIKKRKKKNVVDLSLGAQGKLKGKGRANNLKRLLDFFNDSEWLANKQAKYTYTFHFNPPSTSINRWVEQIIKNEEEYVESDLVIRVKNQFEEYTNQDVFNEEKNTIDSISQTLLRRNIFTFINTFPSIHIGNRKFTDEFCLHTLFDSRYCESLNYEDFVGDLISFKEKWNIDNKKPDYSIDNDYFRFHCARFFDSILSLTEIVYYSVMNGNVRRGNEFNSNDYLVVVSVLHSLSALPSGLANNFRYGWEGFSTGELAKLNLFSSIYNIVSGDAISGLVIIDEVDLFLHPEWQRSFVSELISFNKEYNRAKLQFLITTHSPLIIGDLLSDDIISMFIPDNGVPLKIKPYGFGTEITDAYVLGMHIQSTFGEHSRLKLLELIDKKKRNEISEDDKNLIRMISNQELKRNLLND